MGHMAVVVDGGAAVVGTEVGEHKIAPYAGMRSNSRSALEQHQRTNLQCLQWQRFNRGGVSWNDAMASAVRRKARQETRAIAASAKMEVPIEHGKGRRETGEDAKREKEEPRPRRQRTSKRDKRPL